MSDLAAFYEPKRIAIVGASPGKAGFANLALTNALNGSRSAKISVIHPRAERVDGIQAQRSLVDLQERPDLCVIGVRASEVPSVLRDCVSSAIPAAVIVASGFAEQNTVEGRRLQGAIDEILRGSTTRVIGPNAMGVANFAGQSVTIASANVPADVRSGSVAIVSQSGGIAITLLRRGLQMGLSFSSLTTLGNEMDVSFPEVVRYLAGRDDTTSILAYVEAVRNPNSLRDALEFCTSVAKPLILVKGGRTAAGARATASHTGALATNDAVWRGALAQFGAIAAQGVDHALATAAVFSRYGIAKGGNIGAFATGGGGMVLLADLMDCAEISLPEFSPATKSMITRLLPDISANNPFEMGGQILSGDGAALSTAIGALDGDPNVDALTFLILPMVEARARVLCGSIVKGLKSTRKPAIVLSYDGRDLESATSRWFRSENLPVIDPPEAGAAALKSWLQFDRRSPRVPARKSSLAAEDARAQLRIHLDAGHKYILEAEGKALLKRYGARVPSECIVTDENTAVAAAAAIGFPIAMKVLSEHFLHRGVGEGVFLNIDEPSRVCATFRRLSTSAGEQKSPVLIQEMVKGGVELMFGAARDPSFGLVMAMGAGGANVERQDDVVFLTLPASAEDVVKQMTRWAGTQRGKARLNEQALTDACTTAILVAQFLSDAGELIEELDLNPVIVNSDGATIVDALIVLRTATGGPSSTAD